MKLGLLALSAALLAFRYAAPQSFSQDRDNASPAAQKDFQ
jgi:hypothetical protein